MLLPKKIYLKEVYIEGLIGVYTEMRVKVLILWKCFMACYILYQSKISFTLISSIVPHVFIENIIKSFIFSTVIFL